MRFAHARERSRFADAPAFVRSAQRKAPLVVVDRGPALRPPTCAIARSEQGVGRWLRDHPVVRVEVQRREAREVQVVGRPRLMAVVVEMIGDPVMQPHTLSLRQAVIRYVLHHRVPDTPARDGAVPFFTDQDFRLLEPANLLQRGVGIDHVQLVEIERHEEDGGMSRELAEPRRQRIEAGRDHGLDGRRDPLDRRGRAAGLGHEHAGRLHDEEGIAVRPDGDARRLFLLDALRGSLLCQIDRLLEG